jgi:Lar family restriction alleviation protein
MPAEENLKPCPFCGSSNVKYAEIRNSVVCDDCECFGPSHSLESHCVRYWNRRAEIKE